MNIDTTNKFMVCAGGNGIWVMRLSGLVGSVSPDDALLLAAYLVALAEHGASNAFADVLKAVEGV